MYTDSNNKTVLQGFFSLSVYIITEDKSSVQPTIPIVSLCPVSGTEVLRNRSIHPDHEGLHQSTVVSQMDGGFCLGFRSSVPFSSTEYVTPRRVY